MKSRNEIKANVMYNWDAKTKRTKFAPNDTVVITQADFHYETTPERQLVVGKQGRVIAVTTVGNGNIRNARRQFTRYYVELSDGRVFGFHSQFLKKAPTKKKKVTMVFQFPVTVQVEVDENLLSNPSYVEAKTIEGMDSAARALHYDCTTPELVCASHGSFLK